MEVNRFWGNAPVAQYNPTSLQEMAYAPAIMYQREQDLTSKVDAMNDATATLKGMLGDKAGKTEEFDAASKDLMKKISEEGFTQRNLELAKNLRKTYLTEVDPMTQFAKAREQYGAEYFKAAADKNNIILGNNPLQIKYEDWKNNPSSMQFSTLGRDKLYTYGAKAGDSWAKGNTKQTVDGYGRIVEQKGFKNAAEALNAYRTDPNFQSWVETQTLEAARTNGVDTSNPEVISAIRNGIMDNVVGGTTAQNLPAEYLRGLSLKNPTQRPGVISMKDAVSAPTSLLNADDSFDALYQHPSIKGKVDELISGLTEKKIANLEDLKEKQKLVAKAEAEAFHEASQYYSNRRSTDGLRWGVPITDQPLPGESVSPTEKARKKYGVDGFTSIDFNKVYDEVKKAVRNDPSGVNKTTWFHLNNTAIDALSGEPGVKAAQARLEAAGEDLLPYIVDMTTTNKFYGPILQADKDRLGKVKDEKSIFSPNAVDKHVKITSIGYNKLGEPFVKANFSWKHKDNKSLIPEQQDDVVIRLPNEKFSDIENLFLGLSGDVPVGAVKPEEVMSVPETAIKAYANIRKQTYVPLEYKMRQQSGQ